MSHGFEKMTSTNTEHEQFSSDTHCFTRIGVNLPMALCIDDMVLPTCEEMLLVMVPRREFLSRRLEILC